MGEVYTFWSPKVNVFRLKFCRYRRRFQVAIMLVGTTELRGKNGPITVLGDGNDSTELLGGRYTEKRAAGAAER